MSKITASALELIGGTPLLKADRYADKAGVKDATILTKLEYLNPAGSVKDRIALAMIEDAEEKGILNGGEIGQCRKVLRAAALTYVAAAAASVMQLLRLILLFGGRRRDD